MISSDGSAALLRTISNSRQILRINDKCGYFEIERTLELINGFYRIALQFPDSLLSQTQWVASMLTLKSPGKQFFILADTSYGSCCVDKVASQHANCDYIIHYGHACLSPTAVSGPPPACDALATRVVPIQYVFGREEIDTSHAASSFLATHSQQVTCVIVKFDVVYSHAMDQLQKCLEDVGLFIVRDAICTSIGHSSSTSIAEKCDPLLPDEITMSDCVILYIGVESFELTNLLMTNSTTPLYSYNPILRICRLESISVNKLLTKRYLNIHKARDAEIIGIVVGTLAIRSYLSVINSLQSLIAQKGKRSYLISVGKPTVAKLANFLEIEVFAFLACPESVVELMINDSQDYYRPIVTAFELEIALGGGINELERDAQTNLGWIPGASGEIEEEVKAGEDIVPKISDEPHFSLVEGNFVSSKKHIEISLDDDSGMEVANRASGELVKAYAGGASDFLSQRSFRGLVIGLKEIAADLEDGRALGIAKGYRDEPSFMEKQ